MDIFFFSLWPILNWKYQKHEFIFNLTCFWFSPQGKYWGLMYLYS